MTQVDNELRKKVIYTQYILQKKNIKKNELRIPNSGSFFFIKK